MPGPWGPPLMMYPPCPPLAGWYGTWTLLPMHFHLGWSGPAEDFDHGGYYTGDGHYESVGHQQDSKTPRQETQIVQNAKPDHLISSKATTASGQQHKQWVPEAVSSADGSGGNQDQTQPRSKTSVDGKAKPDAKESLEEVAAEKDRSQR
jgi:hypothetical protein